MDTKLQTIFESLDKEIFTPELQEQISAVIEESVNTKVQDRLDLELKQMDESHAEKAKLIIERLETTFNDYRAKVDEDHSDKMLHIKKVLEESFGKKLLVVKEGYEKIIQKEAIEHRDFLTKAIDTYLESYLDEKIPLATVQEAAKNKFSQKQLTEARKLLGIDSNMISDNVKKAVVEGKKQFDQVLKENASLKLQNAITESKRVLAEKTANLPNGQAQFVRGKLAGKTADFINENFGYVLDMFTRTQKNEQSSLLNENKQPTLDRSKVREVLTKPVVMEESTEFNPENPYENMYLEGMRLRK